MKQFLGLLKFEHKQNAVIYGLLCGFAVLLVLFLPKAIVYFDWMQNVHEIRAVTMMFVAIVMFFAAQALLISSLNNGKNQKELWLHSSASIYKLIGAKIVYASIGLIAMEASAFIGIFFVGSYVSGTFLEIILLAIFLTLFVLAMYMIFVTLILIGYALNLKISRYIKKLGNSTIFVVFVLFFYVLSKFPDDTFLQIGKIDLSGLNQYLPTVSDSNVSITFFFNEIYIVEEILYFSLIVLIYIGMCKWIERMLTQ